METEPSYLDAGHPGTETQHEQEAAAKIRDEEIIRLLLPPVDKIALSNQLKANTDLRKRFMHLENPAKQNELDADEILKICRMNPWDFSWQPPLSGNPSEIAGDFNIAVLRTISRVPPFDLVKCGLGYSHKANFIEAILRAVCTVRDNLRGEFENSPEIKNIYIEVEKVLSRQDNRLAHWIVASSVFQTTDAPYDALSLDLAPIPETFAKMKDLVLEQLDNLDDQFPYIDQKCNWNKCSTDLSFWKNIQHTLWPANRDVPHHVAIPTKAAKDGSVSSKVFSYIKRLRVMLRWWGLSRRTHDIEENS